MDSSTIGIPVSTATEPRSAKRPAWLVALVDTLERHCERRAEDREAQRTVQLLSRLDARTLRDIGLDASELSSAALEAVGRIEVTRWRAWSQLGAWC